MKKLGRHLVNLWDKHNHKCYYTGREMSLVGYHTDDNAVTVDRLIPEKGYVEGNVVLCCGIANRVKQDLSIDQLIRFCQEIITHNKEKENR